MNPAFKVKSFLADLPQKQRFVTDSEAKRLHHQGVPVYRIVRLRNNRLKLVPYGA